jgi:hypothetical protein
MDATALALRGAFCHFFKPSMSPPGIEGFVLLTETKIEMNALEANECTHFGNCFTMNTVDTERKLV